MNTSIELFELIKSMNKLEKRHFKLFTEGYRQNSNYIKLFDAINKQEEYDEKKIKVLFKDKAFVNQLHVIKNYLYHLILKSLKSYHAEKTVSRQLASLVASFDILFEKKLYSHASKLLAKTKKIAQQYDRFSLLLDICEYEEMLIRVYSDMNKLKKRHNELEEEKNVLIKKIENRQQFKKIYTNVLLLSHATGLQNNKESVGKYREIIAHPLLSTERNAICDASKGFYYQTLAMCHYYTNSIDKSILYNMKLKEFIEENEIRKKRYLQEYFTSLNNVFFLGRYRLSYKEKMTLAIDFKKMANISAKENTHALSLYYMNTLEVLCFYGHFEKSIPFLNETIQWLSRTPTIPATNDYDIRLYQKISYAYFGLGEFKKALHWLNKSLNTRHHTNIHADTYSYIILYNLIVHYELKNDDLLPYITKSTFRALLKRQKAHEFEKIILRFIRNTSLLFSSKKKREMEFRKLRAELAVLKNDSFEKRAFEYFDFISWLDSKITHANFSECVKQRNESKLSINRRT